MNEKDFLENYLWPSDDRLDRTFTHPVPKIDGLKKCGDFIVQCQLEDTFFISIMTKYKSDILGVTLVDAYKNTQNEVTGLFVRLVGPMNIVKNGYPFLILGAQVSNVSMFTGEREDISTRVPIYLPQADPEQREVFFSSLSEQAGESGISHIDTKLDQLPDFYGPIWLAESRGVNLDMIMKLRDCAWSAYKYLIEQTKEKPHFNYRPLQEHIIFNGSRLEHLAFKRMGLSVSVEAQAAFFSVQVSGI